MFDGLWSSNTLDTEEEWDYFNIVLCPFGLCEHLYRTAYRNKALWLAKLLYNANIDLNAEIRLEDSTWKQRLAIHISADFYYHPQILGRHVIV